MSSKPTRSLRDQLLRWLLLPLLVLLLANAWLSNEAAVATANQAFDRLLLASADAIAEDVEVRDNEIVVDLPYAALQLLESNIQERIFYRVVSPKGQTITGYQDLPLPPHKPRLGQESMLYTARYGGELIYLVALNKEIYGVAKSAPVVIIVAETGEARYALSHQIVMEGLARQGLLIVAAGLLAWFGLARGLRPLAILRKDLMGREPGDLGPIDAAQVQIEVRPLIDALNEHTARIERLVASRRRVIADASHQMRTPLTEMRTQIEYVLRQPEPALWERTLVDVHADLDRLSRLIAQMLLAARSDPDVWPDQRIAPVDLSELAHAASIDFVPAARKRAMDLSFEPATTLAMVMGNEMLLRELVGNLIENAILHGREGGSLVVRVVRAMAVMLEVEDDGPGIALADRERVFERFHRARAVSSSGSGLGLSIVRDICTSHRARIELGAGADGRGLLVRVLFKATAKTTGSPTVAAMAAPT